MRLTWQPLMSIFTTALFSYRHKKWRERLSRERSELIRWCAPAALHESERSSIKRYSLEFGESSLDVSEEERAQNGVLPLS